MTLTSVRHRAEYGLVLAIRGVVGALPPIAARAIGAVVGFAFYAIDGAHRRLAVSQLRAAFPVLYGT